MASRFARMRWPLVISAAAAVTAVAGTAVVYRQRKSDTLQMPIVAPKRDHTGRIQPPVFPKAKGRDEQLADLRRSGISMANSSDEDEYDLLVIGGGATGTGIALDAVTRGLKVALVERDDFSSGTSSKSTKLVHGGVRYLEKAVWNLDYSQLELVMEALHERKTFLDIAPHLAHSLPILLPVKHWWEAAYFFAGTLTYDMLAGSQGIGSSYLLSKKKTLAQFPMIRTDNLVGGVVYYDGQQNDARMNISLAMTAALYGATVLNHVEVTGLQKNAQGKISGATVRNTLAPLGSQEAGEFVVRAKGVINATGPFADSIEHLDDSVRKPMIAPSSGAHIILPKSLCPFDMGLLKASSDGRVIFILPWEGQTLAGTTDKACHIEKNPVAQTDDIDFILDEVSKLLAPQSILKRSDVLAAWSGIRPLIMDPNSKNTESLVRNHLIKVSPSGLLTCVGGKWTTYRHMAEETVDKAVNEFHLAPQARTLTDISGANLPPLITNGRCKTTAVPVLGTHGYSPALPSQLIEQHPAIDPEVAQHLSNNYGDRSWAILATASASQPTRLLPSIPILEDEIRYAAREEAACTVEDVIARRTRLSFLHVNGAMKALPRIIDIMAEELNWDEGRKEQERARTVDFLVSMGLTEKGFTETQQQAHSGTVKSGSQVVPTKSGAAQVGLLKLDGLT